MKWDVYATIAIQVEADSFHEAWKIAEKTPLEYWDEDSLDVGDIIGHAD